MVYMMTKIATIVLRFSGSGNTTGLVRTRYDVRMYKKSKMAACDWKQIYIWHYVFLGCMHTSKETPCSPCEKPMLQCIAPAGIYVQSYTCFCLHVTFLDLFFILASKIVITSPAMSAKIYGYSRQNSVSFMINNQQLKLIYAISYQLLVTSLHL